MKREISRLEETINKIIDTTNRSDSVKRLKKTRRKLDYLYAREEKYWEQRSRSCWLKVGDRNTKYFHARATSRMKKNSIDKLKDTHENWVTDSKEICNITKNYFWNLFRSNGNDSNQYVVGYIRECITREHQDWRD
ncbi:hypothetical protein PVK06_017637 [Gossypium arboreum]|uniref:Uncharacterized protein n=1 Tax=Gossypium arboreum TaxID=29729 RepID=A0ABR0Q3X1_GOSAR|nr:hypothetical protein PVK06_017637 [Gossypium arboreum]